MSANEESTISQADRRTSSPSAKEQIFLRPASLYKYLISRGPLLIGWDDDKFRDLVERSKTVPTNVDTKDTFGEDRRKMEELKSDLSHVFVDALVTNLSQLIQKGEDVQYTDSNMEVSTFMAQGKQYEDQNVPLYDLISHTVKYHRDSYFTGPTYASIQKFQRTQQYSVGQSQYAAESLTWNHIPLFSWKKEESLASIHLQGFVNWFIPSKTMVDLVRPTVFWTLSPPSLTTRSSLSSSQGGPLYTPLVQAITNLIPLSQTMVDQIFKDNLIHLLKSPEWRLWVKGTTGGYVSRLQRDVNQ
jgi:hypothetical protein